ncbi:MAG: phosphate acyltransferase PlsX [Phycisphaerales bacterium]|nr:phosphate acyltransferase PlsX [Phycisphaerales bacterium]
MRIGIDVMGGDHAPDAILKGCMLARELLTSEDRLVLIGREPVIREYLADYGVSDPRFLIHHCQDVIEMHEPAVEAVRGKPESSIVHMAKLGSVKAGAERCDAVLSAGSTGACVSAATMYMRRLEHVHRPGIAVTIPTFSGPFVLIDAGGNPEPRDTHLRQYGVIGEVVARKLLGRESPRVAVLNIGTEEGKGTDLIGQTYNRLKNTPGINFVGYVEGRELFEGVADVVVSDGMLGNTVLKTVEGLAKSLFSGLAREIMTADPNLMIALEPVFKDIFKKNDYHEHGGAPLLGVNGVCMIAHGSSNDRSIRAAIRQCQTYVRNGLNQAIVERLTEIEAMEHQLGNPAPVA